jgi:hypothetical protein
VGRDGSGSGRSSGAIAPDRSRQWNPAFHCLAIKADQREISSAGIANMTKAFAAAAMILLLAPSVALAQHRAGDAALGAVSGAVVLGPIGAVAGAFIGYSAGPTIARSWGLDRSRASRNRKQATKDDVRAARAEISANGASKPAPQAQPNERVANSGNAASNPPPAAPPPVEKAPPPVQTLE